MGAIHSSEKSTFWYKALHALQVKIGLCFWFHYMHWIRHCFDKAYNDLVLSTKVLITLMKPLLNKRYCFTVDNYHISPLLSYLQVQNFIIFASILVENHTDMHGIVRLNHKNLPVGIKRKKLKREVSAYTKDKNDNVEIDWLTFYTD